MALRLDDKRAIVAAVNAVASDALSAVVADYRGLTVSQMTVLREQARETGVFVQVVRNTLAKRAIEGTEFECLSEALVGPTILAFSQEDPGAAARLFKNFAKENDALEVTALSVGGVLYGSKIIVIISSVHSRVEALSTLASVLQAPVAKFVRTLNEIPTKAARDVNSVKDKKQEEAA